MTPSAAAAQPELHVDVEKFIFPGPLKAAQTDFAKIYSRNDRKVSNLKESGAGSKTFINFT